MITDGRVTDFWLFSLSRSLVRLITISWLVFIIGYLILKGKFALMTVFGSAPTLLFTVLPLALVVFHIVADRHRVYVTAAVVGLLLGVTQLYPNIMQRDVIMEQSHGTQSLKVLNWNTEMWDMGKDSDAFFEFLTSQQADIYILQERLYNADHEANKLNPQRFTEPHPITTAVSGFADDFISLADVSELEERFPDFYFAAHQQFLVISRYPIIDAKLDPSEQYQVVDLDINGLPFRIFNVHMLLHLEVTKQLELINPLNSGLYQKLEARFDAREIGFANLEREVNRTEIEYLIAGDFNSTPHMGVMDSLFATHEDLFRYSNALLPFTIKFLGVRLWQIDYIFMKKNSQLKVKSFSNEPVEHLSDHNVQLFELWLNDSSGSLIATGAPSNHQLEESL